MIKNSLKQSIATCYPQSSCFLLAISKEKTTRLSIVLKNSANLIVGMLKAFCVLFCDLGCKMFIKLHFINSQLDQFQQGEQFHQDLMTMEARYQGRWDKHMMAGYCWSINRDDSGKVYKRKSYKRKFLPDYEQTRSLSAIIFKTKLYIIFLIKRWRL